MGMSIGDSIKALLTERKTALHENKKAFDFAVDTMRKYKKIEQIVKSNAFHINKDNPNCVDSYYEVGTRYREICEVIEDGNDD